VSVENIVRVMYELGKDEGKIQPVV
jgi:hypothetical protein